MTQRSIRPQDFRRRRPPQGTGTAVLTGVTITTTRTTTRKGVGGRVQLI